MSTVIMHKTFRPLAGLGQTDTIAEGLEDKYDALRRLCIQEVGIDLCNTVLPANVYSAMGRPEFAIPWWGWMIFGWLAGRILRV